MKKITTSIFIFILINSGSVLSARINENGTSKFHLKEIKQQPILKSTFLFPFIEQKNKNSDVSNNKRHKSSHRKYNATFHTTQQSIVPVVTRGAYLQKLNSTETTIRWRTDILTNSKIQFGTTLTFGSSIIDTNLTIEHLISLNGLTPATRYYYSIGTTSYVLQGDSNNNFFTAPLTGTIMPVRIWATGDFGNGSAGQIAVRNSYMNYPGANETNLWIWLGDNAYSTGTDSEYQAYVFNKYTEQLKKFPLFPAPGNHDYANIGYQNTNSLGVNFPYFKNFSVPQNGECGGTPSHTPKYYSYNYSNIHFIALDSYGSLNSITSAMYQWLQNDLDENKQRWTIVYFHHPPYTMGTHNSDTETELIKMRQNILPLLENKKVDLVLCGHSHVYERTCLLTGHYGSENSFSDSMKVDSSNGNTPYYLKTSPELNGTVYAVIGNSGQGGNVTTQTGWPHSAMYAFSKSLYGSMVIDVNGDSLNAKFLTSTETIFDQFKIVKSGGQNQAGNVFLEQNPENIYPYPNPFVDHVFIKYNLEHDSYITVEISDIAGRIIYSKDKSFQLMGANEILIDSKMVKNKKGFYIVRIITDNKVLSGFIEKQ